MLNAQNEKRQNEHTGAERMCVAARERERGKGLLVVCFLSPAPHKTYAPVQNLMPAKHGNHFCNTFQARNCLSFYTSRRQKKTLSFAEQQPWVAAARCVRKLCA